MADPPPAELVVAAPRGRRARSRAPRPGPSFGARVRQVVGVAGASLALVGHVLQNTGRLLTDAGNDTSDLVEQLGVFGTSAGEVVPELRRLLDATPRLTRLTREVLRVVASYRLFRARCELTGVRPHPDDMDALHRANAERIYRLCVEQRGALIKVGQLASSRLDLLPQPWVEVLSRLQDQVPSVPTEAIVARLEAELGAPVAEAFAELAEAPLATASIAQVHAARLHDGTDVVVKVRLPGVVGQIEADLTALRLLARLLDDHFPQLDLVTFSDELGRAVLEELDFRKEAANVSEIAGHLAEAAHVVVPRVIESHSTGTVLTLTRLAGMRLVDFLEASEASGDLAARDRVLETLIRMFCVQVLEGGLFHADPHPGNFLVLPGPRVGLLDFGCVMRFSAEQRRAYGRLAAAVLGRDAAGMAELLGTLGFRARRGADDEGTLRAFAEGFLDLFHADLDGSLAGLDPADQLNKALTLMREQPSLRVPQDFVLLARVFAALSGLMLRFKPDLRLLEIAWPSLARAMA